ncbi:efflux RND transporter periplasmic adaptor subunit [Longimicrobium sp.]|uniref:efflux RND transporter periplasmic adaptor subunit n=1 Tax=Longimicrobium sp. TaxID=2029185 RepID=UPI002E3770B4|nr:efflux RND transporter periplasmic adaptor subunit [Longimicrobium sp.]HEX6042675.1 efflux RND transporter periplasmic adaptor subunit [Longimicrobium sp.]
MTDGWMGMIRRAARLALVAALLALPACGDDAAPETKAGRTESADHAGEPANGEAEHAGEDEHAEQGRVTLTEAAYRTAGIQVEPVVAEGVAAAGSGLQVPGQVEFEPERVAVVSPRAAGRIERLVVVEGDRVRAGQTVALISSREFLTAQNDLVQAVRRARVLAGTRDAAGADALADAARRRLRLLGVGDGALGRIASTGEIGALMPVPAPFSGSIVEARALAGQAVEAGTPLFTIADLSSVDVAAEVPERSMPLLRIGQRATITLAAYPALRFEGRVERLRDQLDPATRTVRAIIHVPNPERALRPGMFAGVTLDAPAEAALRTDAATLLVIPETALVTEGEARYVFVEVAPRTFERRAVEVEALSAPGSTVPAVGRVAVRAGLTAGERIAVSGAFTLKSEMGKAGFEHGH